MENALNTQPQASLGGFLPTGQKVYFTIPLGNLAPAAAYDYVLNYSQTLLTKGLTLTEPGLEVGEQASWITHIVRGTQPANGAKPATPIIYFYADNAKWSDVKRWLNTPEDIAEFEAWSGVKLDTMKSFPAGRLERSKDAAVDDEYVKALTPARRIIWMFNPDYVDGSKTESKRLFERYAITAPPTPSMGNATSTPPSAAPTPLPATNSGIPETTFDDIPSANGKAKSDTDKITHHWKPGDVHEFDVVSVTTKARDPLDTSKGFTYALKTTNDAVIWAFNRDYFRDEWQLNVSGWNANEFHLNFPIPMPAWAVCCESSDPNKPNYWKLDEVKSKPSTKQKQAAG